MKLFTTTVFEPVRLIPPPPFPEIRFVLTRTPEAPAMLTPFAVFGRRTVPVASVPIRLPSIRPLLPPKWIPSPECPETRLPAPGSVPPTVTSAESTLMPRLLEMGRVPVESVPM